MAIRNNENNRQYIYNGKSNAFVGMLTFEYGNKRTKTRSTLCHRQTLTGRMLRYTNNMK